jgi:hypothetical protein
MIELMHTIIAQGRPFQVPARQAIRELLTFGGRAPISQRKLSLAPFDRAIFEALPTTPDIRIARERSGNGHCENLRVYTNGLGRLHIRPAVDKLVDYGLEHEIEIGYLSVDHRLIRWAEARADRSRREEMRLRKPLDDALRELQRTNALSCLLDDVEDSVRHVETVCFYADDRIYAVMERVTNLVSTRKARGLIDDLRQTPVSAWRSSDRLAIAALRALFLSGGSIRFEEFNSIELTAKRLRKSLLRLGTGYSNALHAQFEPSTHPFELGRQVGVLARSISGSSWLRYRKVNGITFQKREHCIRVPPSKATERTIQAAFHRLKSSWPCKEIADPRSFFARAAQDAIYVTCRQAQWTVAADAAPAQAGSPLERLIEDVVISAIRATDADYGMSSSLRRPGELFVDEPSSVASVIAALTPKDFFCCIVGSAALQQRFGPRLSSDVFRAVQARMQFNRWHFIPGNLPRHLVAADRHYFYPPVMPDRAEWVDQFHGGHIRAAVRYSVRSPGPEMVDPPLIISGHQFRGFYDVRVVRIDGPPFTFDDLTVVRCHCAWMGYIWSTIVAECTEPEVRRRLRIIGFANGHGAIIDPDGVPRTRPTSADEMRPISDERITTELHGERAG